MADSIVDIFRKAIENLGSSLTEKQVAAMLREVQRRGVPIDWNGWYHNSRDPIQHEKIRNTE